MRRSVWTAVFSILVSSGAILQGCATEPAPIAIHEERGEWIGLQYDAAAKAGHRHPHRFTPEQLTQLLSGVTVTPRDTIVGFLQGETHRAFTAQQITRLAPHFVEAFKKASPRDMVVFYLTSFDPRMGRLVTSGGLCVRETRLYLILANYLTPPSAGPFEGTAYELDARDSPLLPIARYKFVVGFMPEGAQISNQLVDTIDPYRANMDASKRVVVDLSRLSSEVLPGPSAR